MFHFTKPLSSHLSITNIVCSNEMINVLTEVQSSEKYLLCAICIYTTRRSSEITRFTHLSLFQKASQPMAPPDNTSVKLILITMYTDDNVIQK